VSGHLARACDFLCELIRFPSTHGEEGAVQEFARRGFTDLGWEPEAIPFPEGLASDPEYTRTDESKPCGGRANFVVRVPGEGSGRSLILNSHTDVVPARDWPEAFSPRVEGDLVVGRGASDAKGNVAVIYLVAAALRELGVRLAGDLELQVVIEEEVGGNGSLALIRQGHRADGVVVLECSDLKLHPANRGVIWFRATVEGKPVHMGKIREGVSAIDKTYELIQVWRRLEGQLIAESADQPLFAMYEQPVQMNVGVMHAGEWPAMVPARSVIEGGFGFLPNRSLADIKRELLAAVEREGSDWLRSHYRLEFPKLHNDAFATPVDHPLVTGMSAALREAGLDDTPTGWIVSCDARLFAKVGGMPTVVFGAGTLADAHSNRESVRLADIARAAEVLVQFVGRWCGPVT
jgi:acetylornithine deacetylase